jgi:glycerol-1-phosphate dehydrogenase [NAD(P)+]
LAGETHRIDLPRIVLIGRGVLGSVGNICRELGFRSVLLLTGIHTLEVAGRRTIEILMSSGVAVRESLAEESNLQKISDVQQEITRHDYNAVIGVGGGRIIDIAKISSANAGRPFISIPTVASHDGIAGLVASVKGLDRPYSIRAQSPIAVIADSDIIRESPYRFTASGCGDVISKTTSVKDWKLAHEMRDEYYGTYAASLASMGASLVMEDAKKIRECTQEGIRTLLEALVSCGVAMSIAGSSRPCSGSEHLFSHALDMIAPNPALHGEQCGVGTIMMARLHGLDWEEIRNTLSLLGAPTCAKDLGLEAKYVVKALVKAKDIRPDRFTILDQVNLGPSDAETLAESCGVI